ncbi:MAG TPA: hypothetical protein PKA82_15335 [Pyrinomonadaceae bacterium]|nr:hypothetical protein [Pyrinomonadaceae bacterium]
MRNFRTTGYRCVGLSVSMIFVIGILCLGTSVANAQPFALDEKIKPSELKLTDYTSKDARMKGKVAVAEVTQKNDSLYFFVKGISIFSPVIVLVESMDKTEKLNVSLHKNTWNAVEASGETGADGIWSKTFTTGGDVGIKVGTKKFPAKYQVVVWVGDEVDLAMPNMFKSAPKGN